jgi:O-methyltransferase
MSRLGDLYDRSRNRVAYWRQHKELAAIFHQFREYTMIAERTYITNLELAKLARNIPGCVVECGVWRGGMSAGMATLLGDERAYFLFDSFEGLPPAQEIDGKAALEWQGNKNDPNYLDNCSASPEIAEKAMRMAGVRNVQLCKGWFEQTLPTFIPPCQIALLRLDGDWYSSTTVCLDNLFDRVAPKGLILLDDYYTWDGCSRALHDFLSRRSAVERIRNRGDVCYIVKA